MFDDFQDVVEEKKLGGDGTEGQDTEEILKLIKNCRRTIEVKRSNNDNAPYFEAGDLVYDIKHEEHGVVLGQKPELLKTDVDLIMVDPKPRVLTYMIMTVSKNEDGELKTRIRYTSRGYLRLIPEDHRKALSDLDWHCSMECVSQCCNLCSLSKHKRVRDPGYDEE